jgi:hypothetical protein
MEFRQGRAAVVAAIAVSVPLGLAGTALAGDDKGKGDERPQTAPGQTGDVPQGEPRGEAKGHAKQAEKQSQSKAGEKKSTPPPRGKALGRTKAKKAPKAPAAPKAPPAKTPSAAKAGKVTICHATGSATNPYVTITISQNAADAHRAHQDGRDIVPAPAGGCPSGSATQQGGGGTAKEGKVTICHATGSATNPFVVITISENAVDAHRRHQDGRDIVPAPANGCPATATTTTTTGAPPRVDQPGAPPPTLAPAGQGGVLGESVSGGGTVPAADENEPGRGGVLPATAERRETGASPSSGSLPFTGFDAWMLAVMGIAALLAGVALYRRSSHSA